MGNAGGAGVGGAVLPLTALAGPDAQSQGVGPVGLTGGHLDEEKVGVRPWSLRVVLAARTV